VVLTANAVTGRGWVDPLFGRYSSEKEEMINGVRVKRLKTQWQITSAMYLLKNIAGNLLPDSIGNIISLLSVGPYLSNLEKEFQKESFDIIHRLSLRPHMAGVENMRSIEKTFFLHAIDSL
jgi:hypothetical protein